MKRWLRTPEAAVFALVLVAYAYFYQAGGWNQNSRFALTRAIAEEGTIVIDRYACTTGDLSYVPHVKRAPRCNQPGDGHFYCDKAPGASWLAVPPYAMAHALGAGRAWTAWWCTVLAVALPSALAAMLLAIALRALGLRAGIACAAASAWALATLAWPYGTMLYGHQTTAALLLIGFALVVIPRARGELASTRSLILAGLTLGYAVVVEYPAALACVAIGVYVMIAHGWKRAAILAAAAIPPAIALALYHRAGFGGLAALPYDFSTQDNRSKGFFMGLGAPDPTALWHLLFSDTRGLFFSAPWLLLAIPGGVVMARRGRALEAAVSGAIVLLFVWLNASLVDWDGGWALGARYLVPCLPFLALLAAGLFVPAPSRAAVVQVTSARRFDDGTRDGGEVREAPGRFTPPRPPPPRHGLRLAATIALAALVGFSAFNMLAGTAVEPQVDKAQRHPFTRHIWPKFFAGELGRSTQRIDAGNYPRAKPGKPAPPHAAWNLGQKVGLPGLASLLPLLLIGGGCAIAIRRASRRIDTEPSAG